MTQDDVLVLDIAERVANSSKSVRCKCPHSPKNLITMIKGQGDESNQLVYCKLLEVNDNNAKLQCTHINLVRWGCPF